jgi:protein-disulfide isomerase
MSGENKIIWATVGLAVVGILAVFGILIGLAPSELSDEEKEQFLIQEDSYVQGISDAQVTIVAFEDFQCPACASVQAQLEQIKEEYPDDVRFIFRHFPLRTIHPNAQTASEASEAAGEQDKFYEYHDYLFSTQAEWSSLTGDDFIEKLVEYAEAIEVEDLTKFESELRNGTYTNKVNRDYSDGVNLGIDSTPTIFINGEEVSSLSYQGIKKKIDSVLDNE